MPAETSAAISNTAAKDASICGKKGQETNGRTAISSSGANISMNTAACIAAQRSGKPKSGTETGRVDRAGFRHRTENGLDERSKNRKYRRAVHAEAHMGH